jgi:hypothetical protein
MRSLFHAGNVSRFERELGRLVTPEKIGLNQRPEDRMTAELGKNIDGVNLARGMWKNHRTSDAIASRTRW